MSWVRLDFDDFHRVTLDDRPAIMEFYREHPPFHSDNSFTTMASWQNYCEYRFAVANGCLLLMNIRDGKTQLRAPMGPRDPDVLRRVMELALENGSDTPLGFLDSDTKAWIEGLHPKSKFAPVLEYFEYVYRASDLAELPGQRYTKMRNKVAGFVKSHRYAAEPVSNDNIDDMRAFLRRWCLWRDCDKDPLLASEREAITYSMDHFGELGLSGLALRIDGEVQAMSVFETLSPGTAVVHYEKGLAELKGVYQVVNQETARVLARDHGFINRQSDLGIAGLREAKQNYHPHHMVEVYQAARGDLTI